MTTPNNETTSAEEKYRLALDYHMQGRPGKIEVTPTKACLTARDLSLAYSPGVAAPCLEIAKNPDDVYKYTAKGNLVAVLSNGTAVLGLGDIGALAGKPVMEGKGVLFKRFADIDVFDIEISSRTVEEVVAVVKALEPTFGGINLEDIKAPECFEIENVFKRFAIFLFSTMINTELPSSVVLLSSTLVKSQVVILQKLKLWFLELVQLRLRLLFSSLN